MTQARNLSRLLNKKLETFKFTATAGQTTFSDSDDAGNVLSYTPENMLVTYNGVVLENGSEYTATNGTSVVLDTGADSAAEVNIYAFESVSLGGYLDTSTGGTVGGPISVPSGATGSQVAQVQEVVKKTGDTMVGALNLATPGFSGGLQSTATTGDTATRWRLSRNTSTGQSGKDWFLSVNTDTGAFAVHESGVADRMLIDTAGRVTMPYQPAFNARRESAGFTVQTSGVITWNVVQVNVGSHYNPSTGIFTAPVSGVYQFNFFGIVGNSGAGGTSDVTIQINGVSFAAAHTNHNQAWDNSSFTVRVALSANDQIQVAITSSSNGCGLYVNGSGSGAYNSFSGHLIG